MTLETLEINKKSDYCLIINPKPVTIKCVEIAGLDKDNIIEVYRNIDKSLLDLNEKIWNTIFCVYLLLIFLNLKFFFNIWSFGLNFASFGISNS